jgi:hypothetical protein
MANITVNFFGVKKLEKEVVSFLVRFIDKKKMLGGALKGFFQVEEKMFNSGGGINPWAPLTQKYKDEKARLGFGNMPIMQLKGTLKNALTGKRLEDLIVSSTEEGFNLFLLSNYWHNHQFGTTITARPTVNFTPEDEELIIKSMLNATVAGRLSRLFT